MADHFLREQFFSPAGHASNGSEAVCLAAVHLTIARGDIDRALSALLVTPRLTRRWIATADIDPAKVRLVIYLQARHGTQAWRSARDMEHLLRRDGVPVYALTVTAAQDWSKPLDDEHVEAQAS